MVADASVETVVLILAGLAAGCEVVLLNPKSGEAERAHILGDARPERILTAADVTGTSQEGVAGERGGALIIYTSGTTGPPKGVVLAQEALRANLAAVYEAWAWTAADRVVHALPLYHVHGLLLGTLGPLWRGGSSHHVGRFDPHRVGDAVRAGGTMVFGVPTMWSRSPRPARRIRAGAVARRRPAAGVGLGRAAAVAARAPRPHVGRRVIERYGMTETLVTVGERRARTAAPGSVGTALPGVDLRLAGEEDGLGEIEVRRRGCSTATSTRRRRRATRSRPTATSAPATSRCAATTACCGSSAGARPT